MRHGLLRGAEMTEILQDPLPLDLPTPVTKTKNQGRKYLRKHCRKIIPQSALGAR